jgi:hypothetical protein
MKTKSIILLILLVFSLSQRIIIDWVKCPDVHMESNEIPTLESTLQTEEFIILNNIELVCSYIKVPVNWDNLNINKNFTFFIRKLKANKERKGQIWSILLFIKYS